MSMNEIGGMGAEAGFEGDDIATPLRFSGFLSLLLGLLSWVSILAIGAMVIPLLALLFGLIALRPSRFGKPVGTLPAKFGICLAVGLGMCGYLVPVFKTQSLGEQAKTFALDYIDVVNAGYDTLAIELKKEKRNRFSKEMPLDDHYDGSEQATEVLSEFKSDGGNAMILGGGPDANWVLDRPVHVFRQYGVDRAHLVFRDQRGSLLWFFMNYKVDSNDVGQWHVERVQPYRELIVAESVL
jgi:hypothetical protein